jgi:putative ABC transport system permease protein
MIGQAFKMAIKSIAGNKMRSFLTILGVVIGVMAVVVLVAIGQGTTSEVTSSIEGMGTNLLTVSIRSSRNNSLTLEGLEEFANSSAVISSVAPTISQASVTLKADTITYEDGSMIATVPGYDEIRNYTLAQGRFLKQPDLDNRSLVAVVGSEVAEELYGTRNVLGETFSYEGYVFTIVGVLEEKGTSTTGSSDAVVMIPFTLGERIFFQKGISSFYASAASGDTVDAAQMQLESYLNQQFPDDMDASSGENSAYTVMSQSEILDTLSETTDTLTLMLGGIAGISLLVGGIGIMNIMLVSVSERTREIGIRKAVGASRGAILLQFLIEALVVSGLGGILGLLLSVALMSVLSNVLGIAMTLSLGVAELAIGFSLLIGVVFGLYPSNKASKLRPIEALRYEG